jgi:hypothetical protein
MTTLLHLSDFEAQAAEILAARKERHGDFLRMEDTTGGNPPANDQGGNPPANDDGAKPDDKPDETPEEKAARLETELADAKKHSRTWEQRAKDNKDAAKKLADIEAANATPDQKLQLAEKRAADAETELARYKVAHETALPASLLSLLNGDEDTMRDQAKALLEFRGEQPKKNPPKPDPTQGGKEGNDKPSSADEGKAEAQRRIAARKARTGNTSS